MSSDEIPRRLGYRWAAEWERHAGTWLSWPHKEQSWPGIFPRILPRFADLVRAIARFEPVHVLAGGEAVMAAARSAVGDVARVALHDIPTDDAWCRDHGPIFLVPAPGEGAADGQLPPALVDWKYNAWGGKYPPFDNDDAVPRRIAELLGFRRFDPGLVLEGGSIEGNGAGTLLTTVQCLLNPNRNPGKTRAELEQALSDYLGVRKTIWLERGELAGDDTDGHIDQLARFVSPTRVLAAVTDDETDVNFEPLQSNYRQLQRETTADGQPLEVVPLPMPGALHHQGERLPASYCNFYIANGAVIVPQFGDPNDASAMQILSECFPDREIVGLDALEMAWGFGSWHCLTQQQPSVRW